MSRKGAYRDPVADQATRTLAAARLAESIDSIIGSLDEQRASVVVRAIKGATLRSIAAQDGITIAQARRLLGESFSLLRHPSRAWSLGDAYAIEDLDGVLRRIERSALRDADARLVRCDRHGTTEVTETTTVCRQCPCAISSQEPDHAGRPRLYCCDACRQRAYRRRAAGRETASA